jgi:uncharacterized membrane protein YdbT with pleckstrin-like domain
MSSYVDGALTSNEEVVYLGHTSLWPLALWILIGIVLTPILVGLGILLWVFIKYKTTEIAITNKRVISKVGLISRQTIEMNLQKIESIQVDQSVTGRIFNYGSLVISGGGTPQAPIHGISNPMAFRKAFIEAQERGLSASNLA